MQSALVNVQSSKQVYWCSPGRFLVFTPKVTVSHSNEIALGRLCDRPGPNGIASRDSTPRARPAAVT